MVRKEPDRKAESPSTSVAFTMMKYFVAGCRLESEVVQACTLSGDVALGGLPGNTGLPAGLMTGGCVERYTRTLASTVVPTSRLTSGLLRFLVMSALLMHWSAHPPMCGPTPMSVLPTMSAPTRGRKAWTST